MEKKISRIILDLFGIREDPIRNIGKIEPLIQELNKLGIESPELNRVVEYVSWIQERKRSLNSCIEMNACMNACLESFLSQKTLIESEEIRELRDSASQFHSKVISYMRNLEKQYEISRLRVTKENYEYIEKLLQQLIGIRLEYELIPNLFEKMGFVKKSTTFNIGNKVMEVDGRYEHLKYIGAKRERLAGKRIVIVECTTTIKLSEIKEFEAKAKVIHDKYVKEKENWNYDTLSFEAWIVACYNWKEHLIEEAKSRHIVPITPKTLEKKLKNYRLFDPRIAICPTNKQE